MGCGREGWEIGEEGKEGGQDRAWHFPPCPGLTLVHPSRCSSPADNRRRDRVRHRRRPDRVRTLGKARGERPVARPGERPVARPGERPVARPGLLYCGRSSDTLRSTQTFRYNAIVFFITSVKRKLLPHALAASLARSEYDRAQWILDNWKSDAELKPENVSGSPYTTMHGTEVRGWRGCREGRGQRARRKARKQQIALVSQPRHPALPRRASNPSTPG